VARAARRRPDVLFIGLDADPSHMRRASQHAPANVRFVVGPAGALPAELAGSVSELSVHFPWGSLLDGLVVPSPDVLESIARVLVPAGTLTALLSTTERDGREPLHPSSIDRGCYAERGLSVVSWRPATPGEVAASDSSWAKRLRAADRRPVWQLVARRIGPRDR
jgi:SAM-dependent methyltransferase